MESRRIHLAAVSAAIFIVHGQPKTSVPIDGIQSASVRASPARFFPLESMQPAMETIAIAQRAPHHTHPPELKLPTATGARDDADFPVIANVAHTFPPMPKPSGLQQVNPSRSSAFAAGGTPAAQVNNATDGADNAATN